MYKKISKMNSLDNLFLTNLNTDVSRVRCTASFKKKFSLFLRKPALEATAFCHARALVS